VTRRNAGQRGFNFRCNCPSEIGPRAALRPCAGKKFEVRQRQQAATSAVVATKRAAYGEHSRRARTRAK
jgi:hypothetical protein